jgi:hypothetical protein
VAENTAAGLLRSVGEMRTVITKVAVALAAFSSLIRLKPKPLSILSPRPAATPCSSPGLPGRSAAATAPPSPTPSPTCAVARRAMIPSSSSSATSSPASPPRKSASSPPSATPPNPSPSPPSPRSAASMNPPPAAPSSSSPTAPSSSPRNAKKNTAERIWIGAISLAHFQF